MPSIGVILLIILILVVLVVLALNVKIVQQSKAYVIERLGAYSATWTVGIHFKIPVIERVAKVVSLKEQVVDFPPPTCHHQGQRHHADRHGASTSRSPIPSSTPTAWSTPMSAIENLTATTLRNIIGDMELDQTLTSRDTINSRMRLHAGRSHRPLGHQGQPRGGKKHPASSGHPKRYGKADESRA